MVFGDFVFKKSLGQNFITDEGWLAAVVREIGVTDKDTVVEIGAGAGALTVCLARAAKDVVAFEIDTRLRPVLEKRFSEHKNVMVRFEDALKCDIFPVGFKLVANIPYYITTPLLLKFIRMESCTEICVLVQDDVAARIVAKIGTKDYGALSVTMQTAGECRILKKVPRKMFTPPPNVDSAFVVIKKTDTHTRGVCFDNLVKAMFSARRKTALNALKNYGMDTSAARAVLEKAGIDEKLRPEQISAEGFVKLSQIIG